RTHAPVRARQLLVVQDDFVEFEDPSGTILDHAMPARGIGVLAADRTHGWIYLSQLSSHRGAQIPKTEDGPAGPTQSTAFGLVVDVPELSRVRLGPFDPEKLDATRPLELAIEAGHFIEGGVHDAQGRPISDARV